MKSVVEEELNFSFTIMQNGSFVNTIAYIYANIELLLLLLMHLSTNNSIWYWPQLQWIINIVFFVCILRYVIIN